MSYFIWYDNIAVLTDLGEGYTWVQHGKNIYVWLCRIHRESYKSKYSFQKCMTKRKEYSGKHSYYNFRYVPTRS